MSVSYKLLTQPASEPVSLADLKAYMRVDFSDDDSVILQLLSSARAYCQEVTGRAFSTQTMQAEFIIDRPKGGVLSGPIDDEQENFYHYEQQLGANPFGVSQFYFDLPIGPLQSITSVGTQFTVFSINPDGTPNYTNLPQLASDGITVNWAMSNVREPGRIYFQAPLIVYRWQFVYVVGHTATYPPPFDYLQCVRELVAYWYFNREAQDVPDALKQKLLRLRIEW